MNDIRVSDPEIVIQILRSVHSLKNEGNEPFCCFHVLGIYLPKLQLALALIRPGSGIQEAGSDHGKTALEDSWGFEEDPPGQIKQ